MLGLFRKTEQGIKRTREAWFGRVVRLFERPTFDEGLWDELEELLISADVGVSTTARLIQRLKQRVAGEQIREAFQIQTALKEEMTSMLMVEGGGLLPSVDGGIGVILVVAEGAGAGRLP